jgi:integrase
MKGIYPEGHCPVPNCGKTFKWNNLRGHVCPDHLTPATRYSILIHYKGQRIKRGTTLDGKTLKTFADAHDLLSQAKREIEAHKFDPTKWNSKDSLEFQFSRLIQKWYEEKEIAMKQGKLAYGYVPKLKGYIKNYIEPYFHITDVREIYNLKDFTKQLPEKLSLKYQKNIIDALKSFFKWLRENRLISDLPVFPDKIEVPEYEPETVTREVQEQFLKLVPLEHLPIFTFLVYQGARPGEVCALMGDCIHGDSVTYRRTFSGRKLREHTKTKKVRRNYLFKEVRAILPTVFPKQFVFTHGEGRKPYSNDYLNKLYKEALQKVNEKFDTTLQMPLYEFTKHSFGTQFINDHPGKEMLLQEHFGHTRYDMTKRYAKMKVVDAFREMENVKTFREPSVRTPQSQ